MTVRKPRRRSDKASVEDDCGRDASLMLGESLDLVAAAPLAAAILGLRGGDACLDASAVRRLGGQCLQILLAAQATWLLDGHSLKIASQSTDFTDAAALLGIEPGAAILYGR